MSSSHSGVRLECRLWCKRGALAALVALAACAAPTSQRGLERIETIVVIYAENRSFDHLYGFFPGADGIANATAEQKTQLDLDGRPLAHLPPVYRRGKPDPSLPTTGLPNGPFRIDAPPIGRGLDEVLPGPVHRYYQNREQIADGKNNKYVAASDVGAWVMGYFDGSGLKLWKWAREYTLADRFFMGAFGGSFLNHMWLICACTPANPDASAQLRAAEDERGYARRKPSSPHSVLERPVELMDGEVTPDGYIVNTAQPPYQPSKAPPAAGAPDYADPARHPAPPQKARTIGDTLSAKGVTWAWYAGGWDAALVDGRQDAKQKRMVIDARIPGSPIFQTHHQPFNYFARFAPGTRERAEHLKDERELLIAADAGTLPQVVFYKPAGRFTQHPSYTDVKSGDDHIDAILERLTKSPQWPRMAVIVTYDENGGFWDHAPPPKGDRWGPGTRVPALIISPFSKRGFVDHTTYDTTSIIRFITRRHALEPLPGVRAGMGDLTNAFDLSR